MTYSYTQISAYLACPRRYRYHYLEGWQEKELRASMLFGRAFEKALAAYFLHDDCTAVLYDEWAAAKQSELEYGKGDNWAGMLEQGYQLLHRFAQDHRVSVPFPKQNLQRQVLRRLGAEHDFIGYIDAIGELDGMRCVLDWKTSSSCYPVEPQGVIGLDPQLACYSWLTGIEHVSFVVFVRKRIPEIQYLTATISSAQRSEFGQLVDEVVRRINQAQFPQQGGIHFPRNHCIPCPFVGFCIGRPELVTGKAVRVAGVDLGWLDELAA
jgi:hypothetical protein